MEEVKVPMVGTILELLVAAGDTVEAEDELLILESMKMEIPIEVPAGGHDRRHLRVGGSAGTRGRHPPHARIIP